MQITINANGHPKYDGPYELEMYNPLIDFEFGEPVMLLDKIKSMIVTPEGTPRWVGSKFISFTTYDYKIKQFVRHVYAYQIRKGEAMVQEVRRDFENLPSIARNLYYEEFGCSRGTKVIWRRKKTYYDEFIPSKNWEYLCDHLYHKMAYDSLEISTNEELIAQDPSIKYFGYSHNQEINRLDYIRLLREEPIAETFMKLKLYRFFSNKKAIKVVNENKAFRKWLYVNANECQGMAFQTVYNSFKKNPNTSVTDYYNSLMYRIECGKELAKAFSAHKNNIYSKAIKYTTQEKLTQYIENLGLSSATYFDYLVACDWLKLNFEDTKVLFPRNFNEVHDDYVNQYVEYLEEQRRLKEIEDAERELIKQMKTTKLLQEVSVKYTPLNLEASGYCVLIAKNKMELIEEGSALNHCVGRMHYDERMADEKSLIFFVRKASEPSVPFVTVEYNLEKKRIAQMHAKNNAMPDDGTKAFLNDIWLKYANKLINKIKREEMPNEQN